MKGLIKMFTAAAAVTLMASCSDDLSLSNSAAFDANADLTATLDQGDTRMGVLEDKSVVWFEGDQINVYSPDALKFDTYDLYAGAGTTSGSFKINGTKKLPAGATNLVAVSSSKYLKGVHADSDNKMNLIAIIPANFTQNELLNDEMKAYWPLATPFWDNGISFSGDQLNANMKSLTALLKINIKDLPEGTKAIVLNSHYEYWLNGDKMYGGRNEPLSGTLTTVLEDGAALHVDLDYHFADTLRVDIEELDKDQDKTIFVPIVAGNYTKLSVIAVSGDYQDSYDWEGEVLKVFEDQDFVTTGRYDIAQTASYEFPGTTGYPANTAALSKFIAEKILNDGQHTIKITVTDPISAATNPLTGAAEPLYIMKNTKEDDPTLKQTSVDIVFEQPSAGDFDIVEAYANYNPSMSGWRTLSTSAAWMDAPVAPYVYGIKSLNKQRTATFTFADGEAMQHSIILPSSNLVIKEDGIATGGMFLLGADTRQVSGYTDTEGFTRDASTYDTNYLAGKWNTPRNYRNAGIVIRGSWGGIHIHPNMFGHVYAFGDAIDDEIQTLTFDGKMNSAVGASAYATNQTAFMHGIDSQIDLRVTDMLINNIHYLDLGDNAHSNIFTTGNSAIKSITEGNWSHTNKVSLHASWTMQKLSQFALQQGYDQSEIFTAAQLSSMGLEYIVLGTETSNWKYWMSAYVRSVWLGGTYFPWIGADVTDGWGDDYGSADFEFDGKNCNFRNMYLEVLEPRYNLDCICDYKRIPLDEGLGLIRRISTTGGIKIQNVDLTDALLDCHRYYIPNVGSICGRATADKDIQLYNNEADCIRINAQGRNVGGAFGWVNTPAEVKIKNLQVGENISIYGKTWISSKDKNVGGAIGLISGDAFEVPTYSYVVTGNPAYEINWNYSTKVTASAVKTYGEWVTSQYDNVGGQFGNVVTQSILYPNGTSLSWSEDQATNKFATGNLSHWNDKVRALGQNVGGLIGNLSYGDAAKSIVRGTVEVNKEIYAEFAPKRIEDDNANLSGRNVGGLVGRMAIRQALSNQTKTTEVEGNVRVDERLVAETVNAGGFVGLYEGNKLYTGSKDTDGTIAASGNKNVVKISKNLEAIEGVVGGLYGLLNAGDLILIGGSYDSGSITINNNTISGAYAVGGLIGQNNNGSATANNSTQLQVVTKKDTYPISITYKLFKNTKNGPMVTSEYTRENCTSPLVTTVESIDIEFPEWYTATGNKSKFAGSFGTVIGLLDNVINITDANLTVAATDQLKQFSRTKTNYWGAPVFTSKNPIFTQDAKLELLFTLQNVSQATEIYQARTGQGIYFWGDENGYVGVNHNSAAGSGSYILNKVNLKGDTNYNLYYDWTTPLEGFGANATPWE